MCKTHSLATQMQFRLLEVGWPREVLAMKGCNGILDDNNNLLFAGIRVRVGIFWASPGMVIALVQKRTKTYQVTGQGMSMAIAVSDAAHGGQIVMSHEAWMMVRSLILSICTACPCNLIRLVDVQTDNLALCCWKLNIGVYCVSRSTSFCSLVSITIRGFYFYVRACPCVVHLQRIFDLIPVKLLVNVDGFHETPALNGP